MLRRNAAQLLTQGLRAATSKTGSPSTLPLTFATEAFGTTTTTSSSSSSSFIFSNNRCWSSIRELLSTSTRTHLPETLLYNKGIADKSRFLNVQPKFLARQQRVNLHSTPQRLQWRISNDRGGYVHFQRSGRGGSSNNSRGGPSRRNQTFLLLTGTGVTLIYISSRQEIPYTKRKHAILIDVDSERDLGEATFAQVLREARASKTLLPANHPASLAVRRVGTRIAAVAGDGFGGGFVNQMKGLKWEFAVIHSPQANAFVVPGGKVVVYTGLLRILSSEDELAAVLAHEVAHIVARHAAERITQGSILELGRFVAYIGFGIPIPSGAVAAAFFLPNSRKAETEADAIGIQLAARACYDPGAAASVFEKLGKMETKAGIDAMPKFLRTHPVTSDRIKNIHKMLETAQGLYVSSGCAEKQGVLVELQESLGTRIKSIDWSHVHRSF